MDKCKTYLYRMARRMLEPSAQSKRKALLENEPVPIPLIRRILNHFPGLSRKVKRILKPKQPAVASPIQYDERVLDDQRNYQWQNPVEISILVPLYNTDEKMLVDMLDSVKAQTYPYWQLCLCDASDNQHTYVAEIVRRYAEQDVRICFQKRENEGIAQNTNACFAMARADYIALLDHDDCLAPDALFENAKRIQNEGADFIYSDEMIFIDNPRHVVQYTYKPDFSPETLRSVNYICHLTVFNRMLLQQEQLMDSRYEGSQDHELFLRLTERALRIVHIPRVLYYWRAHDNSVAGGIAAKPHCIASGIRAVQSQLNRLSIPAVVTTAKDGYPYYKVQYKIEEKPLISIIIPNKDHVEDLQTCIRSILAKSTYPNYEIIIMENNSTQQETFRFYQQIQQQEKRITVHVFEGAFNYSQINNQAARHARGAYLVLLNNDIEICTPDWLEQMLMFAQRNEVGAVGAKLHYPDGSIQHGGIIVGFGGVAGHAFKDELQDAPGYLSLLWVAHNVSAVTAACMMVRRNVWIQMGGLDERFAVAFNDVDFCMNLLAHDYQIIFTPFAQMIHAESKSRGMEDTPEKVQRFQQEVALFQTKWHKQLQKGDVFYNPNLSLQGDTYTYQS